MSAIAIDQNGTKWIGTVWFNGLYSFDSQNWTTYNTSNSGLSSNAIMSIAIEEDGTKWIGTRPDYYGNGGGLAAFDDSNWVVYDTSNSGLPSNWLSSVAIDSDGTKWIGASGLVSFDGTVWFVYNGTNSPTCLSIDGNNTKWMGAWTLDQGNPPAHGLIGFNENGIPVGIEESSIDDLQPEVIVYPNPFTTETTLEYELNQPSKVHVIIYNQLGEKVTEILNNRQTKGINEIRIDLSELKSGIYFSTLKTNTGIQTKKIIKLN